MTNHATSSSLASWQCIFDTDFPDGLTMTWHDSSAPRYHIARVEVIDVTDHLPVVRLDMVDTQKSFVASLIGYTVVRRQPTRARVVADTYDRLMVWDGHIPTR